MWEKKKLNASFVQQGNPDFFPKCIKGDFGYRRQTRTEFRINQSHFEKEIV